mmetsp:Transcript_20632/g.61704  ORF Transcript_20632/g.61704 Transcript_20632/m.61704 type:complete len:211 (+) Transcript_20632:295-927(+)
MAAAAVGPGVGVVDRTDDARRRRELLQQPQQRLHELRGAVGPELAHEAREEAAGRAEPREVVRLRRRAVLQERERPRPEPVVVSSNQGHELLQAARVSQHGGGRRALRVASPRVAASAVHGLDAFFSRLAVYARQSIRDDHRRRVSFDALPPRRRRRRRRVALVVVGISRRLVRRRRQDQLVGRVGVAAHVLVVVVVVVARRRLRRLVHS